MVLLDKLWDDAMGGPNPERGLGRLRKLTTALSIKEGEAGEGSKFQRTLSMPSGPATPGTPMTPSSSNASPTANVWRSVFNPGSNLATKGIGTDKFDKPQPNTPTVYDWMYSAETRSKHR